MAKDSNGGYEGKDRRDGASQWESAMAWVEGHKDNIRRYVAKFLPYSAYAIDDFMQEALTAAHAACCLTGGRRLSPRQYAGFFWTAFHSKCCLLSGDVPARLRVPHETAVELRVHGASVDVDYDEGLSDVHAERALGLLPPRQAQVWRLLLENKSQREVAGILGLSEQAVSNYATRGFDRLKEAVARVENSKPNQPMVPGFSVHMAVPGSNAEFRRKFGRRRKLKKAYIPAAVPSRQVELLLTVALKAPLKLKKLAFPKADERPVTKRKRKGK